MRVATGRWFLNFKLVLKRKEKGNKCYKGSGVQLASPSGGGGSMLSGDDWEDEGVAEEGSAAVPMVLIKTRGACGHWPLVLIKMRGACGH